MGPANANAGRGEWFRATLGKPATITTMVVGASIALLLGAHQGGVAGAALAPPAVLLFVAGVVWWLADRHAEMAFWDHVASSIGFQPFFDATALETTTPLLHAGDRRFWKHELMGPLGDSGLTARLAQYRYDVKEGEDDKGQARYSHHRYTICLVDMPDSMALFPGVYLRADRNLFSGHDWLRGSRLREVELESTAFCDAYDLQVAREQDDGRLRELFDPKTIVWLAEHPLRPHIELRAGFLVVYVPGFIEDLGRLIWLLEAAERIAERVQAEVREVVG
jgi:hypothetical protein